jgi:hypothetical protein
MYVKFAFFAFEIFSNILSLFAGKGVIQGKLRTAVIICNQILSLYFALAFYSIGINAFAK